MYAQRQRREVGCTPRVHASAGTESRSSVYLQQCSTFARQVFDGRIKKAGESAIGVMG